MPKATSSLADTATQPGDLLHELDTRQDEVLARLDELDAQIQAVLESCGVRSRAADDAGQDEAEQVEA